MGVQSSSLIIIRSNGRRAGECSLYPRLIFLHRNFSSLTSRDNFCAVRWLCEIIAGGSEELSFLSTANGEETAREHWREELVYIVDVTVLSRNVVFNLNIIIWGIMMVMITPLTDLLKSVVHVRRPCCRAE